MNPKLRMSVRLCRKPATSWHEEKFTRSTKYGGSWACELDGHPDRQRSA
jgi:hypothetical protein